MRRKALMGVVAAFAAVILIMSSFACARKDPGEGKAKFEIGKWYDLAIKNGPVTIHRFRIERKASRLSKLKSLLPGNSQDMEDLQLQIEYSNQADSDWQTSFDVSWLDKSGKLIDGFHGNEDLTAGRDHDLVTNSLSTSRYGVEQADKLQYHITALQR